MKYRLLLLSFGIWSTVMIGTAYGQGIQFENSDWKSTVAKAKAANKLIYMDIYTTWCGPCKMMDRNIFPNEEVGKVHNKQFVNFKIDAEKGEGLSLAKKYKVEGYPTNLYIDPKDESVVYRVMGYTEIAEFLKRAETAQAEYADPMKWEDYQEAFRKGQKDVAFLGKYLEKAKRLDKPNDDALNVYFREHYHTSDFSKENLEQIMAHTYTLDNEVYPFLLRNQAAVNKAYAGQPDVFLNWAKGLSYATLKKAIDTRNEQLLNKIIDNEALDKEQDIKSTTFWYKKEYFKKTGEEAQLFKTMEAEADWICNKSAADFEQEDNAALEGIKKQLAWQLKEMDIPESEQEQKINETIQANSSYAKSVSFRAALALNESAWYVVSHQSDNKALVGRALVWSQKSLDMTKGTPSWATLADTYAHLLYFDGKKEEAMAMEAEAIKQLAEGEDSDQFEATLKKMQDGAL